MPAAAPKTGRKFFAKCANCGAVIAFGGKMDGERRFCSQQCYDFALHPGFCKKCADETEEGNIGGTFTWNLIVGTHLMGFGAKCPACHSRVMRKWVWIGVPVFPCTAPYRVLYITPKRYLSRKLKAS